MNIESLLDEHVIFLKQSKTKMILETYWSEQVIIQNYIELRGKKFEINKQTNIYITYPNLDLKPNVIQYVIKIYRLDEKYQIIAVPKELLDGKIKILFG